MPLFVAWLLVLLSCSGHSKVINERTPLLRDKSYEFTCNKTNIGNARLRLSECGVDSDASDDLKILVNDSTHIVGELSASMLLNKGTVTVSCCNFDSSNSIYSSNSWIYSVCGSLRPVEDVQLYQLINGSVRYGYPLIAIKPTLSQQNDAIGCQLNKSAAKFVVQYQYLRTSIRLQSNSLLGYVDADFDIFSVDRVFICDSANILVNVSHRLNGSSVQVVAHQQQFPVRDRCLRMVDSLSALNRGKTIDIVMKHFFTCGLSSDQISVELGCDCQYLTIDGKYHKYDFNATSWIENSQKINCSDSEEALVDSRPSSRSLDIAGGVRCNCSIKHNFSRNETAFIRNKYTLRTVTFESNDDVPLSAPRLLPIELQRPAVGVFLVLPPVQDLRGIPTTVLLNVNQNETTLHASVSYTELPFVNGTAIEARLKTRRNESGSAKSTAFVGSFNETLRCASAATLFTKENRVQIEVRCVEKHQLLKPPLAEVAAALCYVSDGNASDCITALAKLTLKEVVVLSFKIDDRRQPSLHKSFEYGLFDTTRLAIGVYLRDETVGDAVLACRVMEHNQMDGKWKWSDGYVEESKMAVSENTTLIVLLSVGVGAVLVASVVFALCRYARRRKSDIDQSCQEKVLRHDNREYKNCDNNNDATKNLMTHQLTSH